jgi:hypothetical protein
MKIDLSHLNLIEKFIVEHGSATVMGVHIQFLRDQLAGLERETTNLKAEVTQLKEANKVLTSQLQQRAAETHRLQGSAQTVGDRCPYCKQTSGVVESIKDDPTFGPFGVKIHYYKCGNPNCGKTYDKRVDP